MNGSKFNVLLYSDESNQTFLAVVYSAMLLMNMPNMHLTVVKLKESYDGSMGTENIWLSAWATNPSSEWMINVIGGSDTTAKSKYLEILNKTKELFSKRAQDISYQVLYSNPSIPETVEAIIESANKKSVELIVFGSERFPTLKGLIYGSFANSLQNKSPIPVLLVKTLSKDYLESYRLKPILKLFKNDITHF